MVKKYLALADSYGAPVAIADFGWTQAETEKLFSSLEDDYQIGRFLQFEMRQGKSFLINGFPQTHVAVSAEIQSLL